MLFKEYAFFVESDTPRSFWIAQNWQHEYFMNTLGSINTLAFGMGGSPPSDSYADHTVCNNNYTYMFQYNSTLNRYEIRNLNTNKIRIVKICTLE